MSGGLRGEMARVLNRASAENGSDTPDFILAEFLIRCLAAFDAAVRTRSSWHSAPPATSYGGDDDIPF